MARRNSVSFGCNCCCNQRQLLAVIVVLTIAMGAPHSDPNSMSDNYLAPTTSHVYFATRNNTKVTAQKGGTALLPCTVLTQTSALVSWIRHADLQFRYWAGLKDIRLLTVGLSTYSNDERFLVHHIRHMGHWALRIKSVKDEDRGLYECQLSVHPPQSVFVELEVVEAVAEIVGAPDLHIDEGSTLRLECKLKQATEYPDYVFWYHEHSMVNFDQQNGFSVTPFQPVDSTASSSVDLADEPYPSLHESHNRHHLHHHNHHHHHHHHQLLQQHHQHHLHLHRLPQHQHHQEPLLDEDDGHPFGLNALDLLNSAALSLVDSDESSLATDLNAGLPVEEQLHQWSLNHSGFLPYSHILPPATSVLTIMEVHSKHAGNYSCAPSNTRPASITVHVLQGEKPAAMQHANRSQQLAEDGKVKSASSSASAALGPCRNHHQHPFMALPVALLSLLFLWQIRHLFPLRTTASSIHLVDR